MDIKSEFGNYTWQSLRDYVDRRITGLLDTITEINQKFPRDQAASMKKGLRSQLEYLYWCVPLVNEFQRREDMQLISPLMSLDAIRLSCFQCIDDKVRLVEFAMIGARKEGLYRVVRVESSEGKKHKAQVLCEGSLEQTVEAVRKIVEQICGKGDF